MVLSGSRSWKVAVIALGAAFLVVLVARDSQGVKGTVQAVYDPGQPPPGEWKPKPKPEKGATVEVWNQGRTAKIASAKTDGRGRFRIPLDPGKYVVIFSDESRVQNEEAVVVQEGRFTKIDFTLRQYGP